MRLFVAVEIPAEVRAALGDLIDRLALVGEPVKWVAEENLHLTLKFLGDVGEERLDAVRAAIDRAASDFGPIEGAVRGAGALPTPRHPRVLYAGLEAPGALARLAARIEDELEALGFARESREWRPHVTLGRVKEAHQRHRPRKGRAPPGGVGLHMGEALAQEAALEAGRVRIDHVTLFKSDLGRGGPTYTPVHEAPLSGDTGER